MKIIVNGDEVILNDGSGLFDLFQQLGVNRESVAVMIDGDVVCKPDLDTTHLQDGNAVDILTLAAGG